MKRLGISALRRFLLTFSHKVLHIDTQLQIWPFGTPSELPWTWLEMIGRLVSVGGGGGAAMLRLAGGDRDFREREP